MIAELMEVILCKNALSFETNGNHPIPIRDPIFSKVNLFDPKLLCATTAS
jgi:hypothetical protein